MKTNYENQFQEFRVRRICSITGKMLEMPILDQAAFPTGPSGIQES
jgi:hypothetical protein